MLIYHHISPIFSLCVLIYPDSFAYCAQALTRSSRQRPHSQQPPPSSRHYGLTFEFDFILCVRLGNNFEAVVQLTSAVEQKHKIALRRWLFAEVGSPATACGMHTNFAFVPFVLSVCFLYLPLFLISNPFVSVAISDVQFFCICRYPMSD